VNRSFTFENFKIVGLHSQEFSIWLVDSCCLYFIVYISSHAILLEIKKRRRRKNTFVFSIIYTSEIYKIRHPIRCKERYEQEHPHKTVRKGGRCLSPMTTPTKPHPVGCGFVGVVIGEIYVTRYARRNGIDVTFRRFRLFTAWAKREVEVVACAFIHGVFRYPQIYSFATRRRKSICGGNGTLGSTWRRFFL